VRSSVAKEKKTENLWLHLRFAALVSEKILKNTDYRAGKILKNICSLNLWYLRVFVSEKEREKETARERETAARNCNTHKQIATQKAAGLPLLLIPFSPLCMCALDALGAIHLLLLPFLPLSALFLFFFAYLWGLLARWQPWQPNALVNKFSTLLSVRDATLKCLQLVAMQRKNAIKT